jgi:hypothetical protein
MRSIESYGGFYVGFRGSRSVEGFVKIPQVYWVIGEAKFL